MIFSELETLKCKCILVNEFMAEHGGFSPAMRPFFAQSSKRIDEAYAMCNIKLLRAISSDIDYQIINHMPFSMALKMRQFLKDEPGADFHAIEILQTETIKKILLAEEIANGEEYWLVHNYLNKPETNPVREEEAQKLNILLSAFQGV
ncbi:hypothetical protein [Pedobacter roseus]|uniref:Uncharacterized protein n=1 Tax=Pedobacter roseus TaxID=336820 RepID=A0A7G9QN91_9SPHI|nr:hypothetical protein [Pedobacter roseus]QNN44816.1 hypothetical protein H9L23_12370 [Pedobacter roseus]